MTKKRAGRVAAAGIAFVVLCAAAPVKRPSTANVGPHPQAKLPPLELPKYELPRPPAVVQATYKFAAEHPEVLSYVPCFCGCEQSGHRANEDCFVKSRAGNGDVTAWNDHGMVCAMCIAVAERSMQMHQTGASVREIRAEVERKFAPVTSNRTPTPAPPSK